MCAYGIDRSIAAILAQKDENNEENQLPFIVKHCINTNKDIHSLKNKCFP